MTFYSDEVTRLTRSLYPHDDLTKHIIQSKLYIDKHFSENINLGKIAGKAMVSKFHFIRVFKKYYGRTPNQYLQEVRIEKAKQLLQKGKTIDEACYAIGFASKTSFISLFKKMTGKTPLTHQNKKAILNSV
ncbi:MAG TPA: AraC family transcriptional regulator [Chitinophagaceae bacterium]|nr:AraC family transcriptional regulator [Chitinophagaceae bacterium]